MSKEYEITLSSGREVSVEVEREDGEFEVSPAVLDDEGDVIQDLTDEEKEEVNKLALEEAEADDWSDEDEEIGEEE